MRFARGLLPAILLGAALGGPALAVGAPSAPTEMTIVYIDLDRIISEVDEGKRAQEQLAKEHAARQGRIGAAEDKLKKLQAKVQGMAQKGKANDPAFQQAAADYQQAAIDYQRLLTEANKEMVDKEHELFDPIERKVKEVLRSIAQKEGVEIVLGRRAIAFARKDLDFTERVTLEYNKLHPAAKGPVSAPAPVPVPSSSAAPKASAAAPAPKPSGAPVPAPSSSAKK
ncbi:MAG: OmpH family outer membrane protein [Polyangiales bacterium]